MYGYIVNSRIQEIIPDIDPNFPNVAIDDRYDADFLSRCEHFADDSGVEAGMVRQEDGTWAFPPVPDPDDNGGDGDDGITVDDLALAVTELAEQEEADKLETEMAIAELAEVILNG